MKTAADLDWSRIEHFVPGEFSDPFYKGSWRFMSAETILMLDWLRKNTGWPIVTHNKHGIRGAVCYHPEGHSNNSFHYVENGAHAVDFHFLTKASIREQAYEVMQSGFTGIGFYYDWLWFDSKTRKSYDIPIGFHCDCRGVKRLQIWKRENGKYIYLLR